MHLEINIEKSRQAPIGHTKTLGDGSAAAYVLGMKDAAGVLAFEDGALDGFGAAIGAGVVNDNEFVRIARLFENFFYFPQALFQMRAIVVASNYDG